MRKFLASFALLAVLTGCTAAPPAPPDLFYRFTGSSAEIPQAPRALNGVVMVDRFTAAGITGGRQLLYTEAAAPNKLVEYRYHLWAEPPGDLLRERLAELIRQSGLSGSVVRPDLRVDADWVITGRILRLEQSIGAQPQAMLQMELGLRGDRDYHMTVLKPYAESVPLTEDSVDATVEALNQAADRIFMQFLSDIAQAL
ncbi:MAG: ABC-type transport auxiliary lipoprotein family protein [Magnetospiraceae bacterium]